MVIRFQASMASYARNRCCACFDIRTPARLLRRAETTARVRMPTKIWPTQAFWRLGSPLPTCRTANQLGSSLARARIGSQLMIESAAACRIVREHLESLCIAGSVAKAGSVMVRAIPGMAHPDRGPYLLGKCALPMEVLPRGMRSGAS
jgi:hypothetical protein